MQNWEYAFVDLVQTSVDDEPDDYHLFLKMPAEEGKVIEGAIAADLVNTLGRSGWEVVGYASPEMSVERFVLKRASTSASA
jgi:hypothetical protein